MLGILNPFLFGAPAGTDYFGADGATLPIYDSATYPPAMYVSATNTTWFAWEALYAGKRGIRVATYNHTSGKWSTDYLVALHSMVDDDHGVPALCRDADGYVHVYYGGHDSDVFESVTNAADDPSAWTLRTTFSGFYAYPHPTLVGSAIYLVFRRQNSSERRLVLFKTSSITSGVPVWGAEQSLVAFGASTRVYASNIILSGTDLHIPAVRADLGDTFRRDVFYFVYKTATGALDNVAGTTSTASGSLPINLTLANSDYRIVTQTTNETNVPGFCFDTNGDPHIAYMDGTGSTRDFKHITFSGGAWSSPATIVTLNCYRVTECHLVQMPSGEVAAYYPEDQAGSFTRGGNIARKVRSAGGVWGSQSIIASPTGSFALDQPSPVRTPHANARLMFCEITQDSLDASGGSLKLYAYGDGGLVRRPYVAPTSITLSTLNVWSGAAAGDPVAIITNNDTDFSDSWTYAEVADPDNKFSVSGDLLLLSATVTAGNTHSVTISVTDAQGNVYQQAFSISVTATRVDPFLAYVTLLLDHDQPGSGTDASIASVKLLLDGS